MSDEKIKMNPDGSLEFNSLESLVDFGRAVNEAVWEPKRVKMRAYFEANPEKALELKNLWYEIRNRDWGAWGLMMTEHGRLFAREAEKIIGEHEWLVPGNYFSGCDLMEVCVEVLGEDRDWQQGGAK